MFCLPYKSTNISYLVQLLSSIPLSVHRSLPVPSSLLQSLRPKAQKVVSHQRKAEPTLGGEEKVLDLLLDYRGLRRQRRKGPGTTEVTQGVTKKRVSLVVRNRGVKKLATKVMTTNQRAVQRSRDPRRRRHQGVLG